MPRSASLSGKPCLRQLRLDHGLQSQLPLLELLLQRREALASRRRPATRSSCRGGWSRYVSRLASRGAPHGRLDRLVAVRVDAPLVAVAVRLLFPLPIVSLLRQARCPQLP